MKLSRATLFQLEIPFRFTFRHALAERKKCTALVLRLEDASGRVGFGEAAPRPYVTGETSDSVRTALARQLIPPLLEKELGTFDEVVAALSTGLATVPRNQLAAFCCLDLALLDLAGKCFECSAGKVLGEVAHPELAYSAAVSADELPAVRAMLAQIKEHGFRGVKLKVGKDEAADTERLEAARKILGDEISLRVDANAAWDADEALHRLESMARFRLDGLEQPLPATDIAGMARVTARSSMRIIADESLASLADARLLAESGACHCFNIRVSKCGGLLGARRIRDFARQAGIEVLLGAHVGETAILSAAGRQFGTRSPLLVFCEGSYGKILLEEDLAAQDLTIGPGGRGPALEGSGLGIEIDRKRLAVWTTAREELAP